MTYHHIYWHLPHLNQWQLYRFQFNEQKQKVYSGLVNINNRKMTQRQISAGQYKLFFFINFLQWQVTILCSHWCSLFWTSVDSTHGFQSQGGSMITLTLLLFAHNDPPQGQLWISKPRPVPILHLGRVRLPLEWPPSVTSGITGRGKIQTQDLATQSPTLYRLSYPGRTNFIKTISILKFQSVMMI